MSDLTDNDAVAHGSTRSQGSGTARADEPEIASGFTQGSRGTARGKGLDIPSGFLRSSSGTAPGSSGLHITSGLGKMPNGTARATRTEVASGFGPTAATFPTRLSSGESISINGQSYVYDKVLSKSTGEAEIFLLRQGGTPYVFKLYYPNFRPKVGVLAPLVKLKHKDIVNVIDHGYFDDRFFELMEYAEGGTLEQYMPIRDLRRLRAIISETVNAFNFCHPRGIIHRDIKPGNIYCRNTNGTDIVIGDFGISSSLDEGLTRRLTSQNLTEGYAAPELYGWGGKVYVGREVDYYALGITLIHLWQGTSPFEGLNRHAIANLTTSGAVPIPADLPRELLSLIRGLITIDFTKRWGYAEIQRWLVGEDVPVHFQVRESTFPLFQFDPCTKADSPEALVRLLHTNPERAKKLLYSGKISAWVNVFDHLLAAEIDLIVEEQYPREQDVGMQKAIYLLDPDEPFSRNGVDCRTTNELATALDDGFSFYQDSLANPLHQFYLYLEAHEAQEQADTFRALFKVFSGKKALNTVILELGGSHSVTIRGQTFTTLESVLQARDQTDVVNMLKDPESRLSLWMDRAAGPVVATRLEAWRELKICDATTLAYVSETGDGVPKIKLSSHSLSFADLKRGTLRSGRIDISNTGGGTLVGPITTNKDWLRLGQEEIDAESKTQTFSFAIDTAAMPYGASDTAVIEVQSNVGTETVSVAITIEKGAKAAARFRNALTLGAGALGALLGFFIYKVSAWAGTADPSSLAGTGGVVGLAIIAGVVTKNNGKNPLLPSVVTLALGGLVLGFLNPPVLRTMLSWSLVFMAAAYAMSPAILRLTQISRRKSPVPIGVAVGAVLLVAILIAGDRYNELGAKYLKFSEGQLRDGLSTISGSKPAEWVERKTGKPFWFMVALAVTGVVLVIWLTRRQPSGSPRVSLATNGFIIIAVGLTGIGIANRDKIGDLLSRGEKLSPNGCQSLKVFVSHNYIVQKEEVERKCFYITPDGGESPEAMFSPFSTKYRLEFTFVNVDSTVLKGREVSSLLNIASVPGAISTYRKVSPNVRALSTSGLGMVEIMVYAVPL